MAQCSEEEMRQVTAVVATGTGDELGAIERLIDAYPEDARLHFLRGSILASQSRPIDAHAALSRAVALAPHFTLARFQLGLFELTSGETSRAIATWEGLGEAEDHYLALFVAGLTHLIHDRFADAVRDLARGIEANAENPPLNRDMQLIIEQCEGLVQMPRETEEASATSFLLGQLGGRGTTRP